MTSPDLAPACATDPALRSLRRVRTQRTLRLLTLLVTSPAISACYTYTTIPLDAAPPNQSVRVVVTRDGAGELLNVLPTDDAAPSFIGDVAGRESGSLLVRVPLPGATSPTGTAIGQLIRVPIDEILSVERRDLDAVRTALFVSGAAGFGALLVMKIIDVAGGPDGEVEDPDFSISFLRVPIG